MQKNSFLFAGAIALSLAFSGNAQTTVLDGFEGDEGRFGGDALSSGSSTGMDKTLSTFTLDTSVFLAGVSSQQIFIKDDPTVDGLAGVYAWRLRHLSGGGAPGSNVTLDSTGNIGYYLRTTTSGLFASLTIDDATNTERGEYKPIVADGQWHVYQWDFDNANDWTAFAGTTANGTIDSATVSLDALYFAMTDAATEQSATFNIDNVAFNAVGQLAPVPEPSTVALGLIGGAGLMAGYFRRRAKK